TRADGIMAEEMAADFLQEHGFSILNRNYRYSRCGEIDIIASRGELLLFVEVRYKRRRQRISAAESVTRRKLARLKKTASDYLRNHPEHSPKETCRFDLITVEEGAIEWIQDIIR
ncbi:MAG: YraN family protein, partial [Spirochaetota bacterium]